MIRLMKLKKFLLPENHRTTRLRKVTSKAAQ